MERVVVPRSDDPLALVAEARAALADALLGLPKGWNR